MIGHPVGDNIVVYKRDPHLQEDGQLLRPLLHPHAVLHRALHVVDSALLGGTKG